MKLTKLGHACLLLEHEGRRLIIDPGGLTELPENLKNVDVIIVTEEHGDHFNSGAIRAILAANECAAVYSTTTLAEDLQSEGIKCTAVSGSLQTAEGSFELSFNETDHAVVYGSSPCRVLCVQVNNFLYYASDSFIACNNKVEVVAAPTSGPWLKLAEVIEYINRSDCKTVLATHNALNSEVGNKVANSSIAAHIGDSTKNLVYLCDGESSMFE